LTISLCLFFALGFRIPGNHLLSELGIKPLSYVLSGIFAVTLSFILNQLFESKTISYKRYIFIALFATGSAYFFMRYFNDLLSYAAQT